MWNGDVGDAVRELLADADAAPGSTVSLMQIVAQVAVARYLRDASGVSPSAVHAAVSSFKSKHLFRIVSCLYPGLGLRA